MPIDYLFDFKSDFYSVVLGDHFSVVCYNPVPLEKGALSCRLRMAQKATQDN